MRVEIAAADRQFAVRRAAGAWRTAGTIDAAAEAAIAALYPDDRVRTSKIFRVLFFVFTWFGFSTASGFGLVFLSAAGMEWESTGIRRREHGRGSGHARRGRGGSPGRCTCGGSASRRPVSGSAGATSSAEVSGG